LDDALEVAGFARQAAGVLELVVIRLQLLVGHGPVLDGRILGDGPFPIAGNGAASDLEIPRGMPPGPARPVKARTAKPLAPGKWPVPPHGPGHLTRAIAARDGRAREVFKEFQTAIVLEVVMGTGQRKILLPPVATPFQPDHLEPGLG